nr:cytochrome c biogenesis protein ResB [Brachybacterium sp. Z12]
MVLGDLPAAVHLADRLHHSARRRAPAAAAREAAAHPSRLTRFTGHTRIELPGADPDALIEQAHRSLRRSRYRAEIREEKASRSVSAERGLLRETGNLAFHIALVGVLVCIAGGQMTNYRGQITVIEGSGFSNSLTQYDSFESGAWFDETEMPPFRFTLEDFRATYVQPGESGSVGEPRSFEADIAVTTPVRNSSRRPSRSTSPSTSTGHRCTCWATVTLPRSP